jgi:hypothetical protein
VGIAIAFFVPFVFGLVFASGELIEDVIKGTFRVERLGGAVVLAAGISFLLGMMAALPAALLGVVAAVFWPHEEAPPPEP